MNSNSKVHQITRMAILVAIIFLLAFTPLGYLTIGPIAATTIQMPVIVGAVMMGPAAGAVLGFFFGLSAVIKVLTMPGADPVATLALAHAPLAYLTVCMGARILMGWLSGLLAAGLKKVPALDGGRSVIRRRLKFLHCHSGKTQGNGQGGTAEAALSAQLLDTLCHGDHKMILLAISLSSLL